MLGISWLAEKLLASQERLCCMESVSQSVSQSVNYMQGAGEVCAVEFVVDSVALKHVSVRDPVCVLLSVSFHCSSFSRLSSPRCTYKGPSRPRSCIIGLAPPHPHPNNKYISCLQYWSITTHFHWSQGRGSSNIVWKIIAHRFAILIYTILDLFLGNMTNCWLVIGYSWRRKINIESLPRDSVTVITNTVWHTTVYIYFAHYTILL
jgi:hypothetical protein